MKKEVLRKILSGQVKMDDTWKRINEREAVKDYLGAIELLETRLELHPAESENVLRLGFDYWLAIA
jgi:hypothetical protein